MAAKEADQEFVEYVVKQLVSKPESVVTSRKIDELGVLVELTVDREDMGVIIGKEGKTAKAIRTLLRVLGAKNDSRINLKIVEPDGDSVDREESEKHEDPVAVVSDDEEDLMADLDI